MADKKISDLTAGSPAQATDQIPIARAGANFKLSLSDLGTVVGAGDVLNTVASSGASQTVNYTTADVWDITLTANCTLTLAGFVNAKPNYLTLVLRQDGTGSRTVTWPTITWIGSGVAPTLQTAASSVDSVVLFSFDGGTTVYGIAQTSASGLRSGTSFPGSPSDGDLFYRTDARVIYEYVNSISKWLSLDRKYITFGTAALLPDVQASTGRVGRIPQVEDFYIESWVSVSAGNTTNNSSNFWTFTLFDGAGTNIGSFSTNGDTAGVGTRHLVSIGLSYTAAGNAQLFVSATKTGAPSTYVWAGTLIVRAIG